MALTPIATQVTLAQALDNIRERTNTISEEESELYQLPLINLLHDAILLVLGKQDPAVVKAFYRTEPTTVTESSNLVDISALDIASVDPKDLTYSDSANGQATVMSLADFENMKTIYSTAGLVNFFIAYVGNISEKMQLRTYRGSALAAKGTCKLGYVRNPSKQLTVAGKLDCPEHVAREAIEVVVRWVPERLKATA